MEHNAQQRTQHYIGERARHPAWQVLASRRAPLVLGCLQTLFEHSHDGIVMDDALQALGNMLLSHADNDDYDINPDTITQQAGRELREWIKRRLVVEREGRLYATDALELALGFVSQLDNRIMTSTASRLSVVQREIENLELGLNPNPASRAAGIQRKIKALEAELAAVEAGHVEVLSEAQAIEGMREVYTLAMGLRADFRRVEDSWREADRELRQSIISEQYHRGEIVDRLLDGHDALLDTPEGRVFDSFQQQLRQSGALGQMKERLRAILKHPVAPKALNRVQQGELRWLLMWLVKESHAVFQARARSERDVKGFLKTGLAAEHHRVGNLLAEVMHLALQLDWPRQAVRRQGTPLPPVGVALSGLPAVERLRFKSLDEEAKDALDLAAQQADLDKLDEEFWAAFDGLDREALLRDTLDTLAKAGKPLTLAELAAQLPPTHDLDTLAMWIAMAREAGIDIDETAEEALTLRDDDGQQWRFRLPRAELEFAALHAIKWEL